LATSTCKHALSAAAGLQHAGVLTETTADTADALMIAAARRIAEGDRFVRSGTAWIWSRL